MEEVHRRFHRFFFPRLERWARAQPYLIGLNLPIEHKSAENLAEELGTASGRLPLGRRGGIAELQRLVGEALGAEEGRRGKTWGGWGDNGQVGVFLGFASRRGHPWSIASSRSRRAGLGRWRHGAGGGRGFGGGGAGGAGLSGLCLLDDRGGS
ncbi:MAG TPA: hypothetical protein VKY90_21925 [Candidatus Dormibacteraeota bacterium]|nr:hypothetical protein [Candidatus Dormibacteraeota bacterium]